MDDDYYAEIAQECGLDDYEIDLNFYSRNPMEALHTYGGFHINPLGPEDGAYMRSLWELQALH
jgi:hypothetical protein